MFVVRLTSLIYIVATVGSFPTCPHRDYFPYCNCFDDTDSGLVITCGIIDTFELATVFDKPYAPHVYALLINLHYIPELPSRAFVYYRNVKMLVLIGKSLESIDVDAFSGIENVLEVLVLRATRLRTIPADAVNRLRQLVRFDMRDGELLSLNRSLISMSLKSLRLSNNDISTVSQGMLPTTLERLNLEGNHLRSLNGSLKGNMIKLKMLNVAKNKIRSLKGELDNVPNLLSLDARWNIIAYINDTFRRTPLLGELKLSSNQILEIGNSLEGLHRLYALHLRDNHLNFLKEDDVFSGLTSLRFLDLGYNYLWFISDGLFECLMSLEYIAIDSNRIGEFYFISTPGTAANRFSSVWSDGQRCNFWKNRKLRTISMRNSGMYCTETVYHILRSFRSAGVTIYGDPCYGYGSAYGS